MDESHVRFCKRVGIRVLRFFGVACTFLGYANVVGSAIFGQWRESTLGWGLIGLGIPHILAANHLQETGAFSDVKKPDFTWLLGTSSILPGAILIFLLGSSESRPRPDPILRLYVSTIVVYFVGVGIVFLRRASEWNPTSELTPKDRTYIRWGWLALLAIALPIAMLITR